MPRAIQIHQSGGPEVMRFENVDVPPPGRGEVRVRHTAIGINFSDVNVRRGGFYFGRPQQFPLALGNEAAGVIEALGAGYVGDLTNLCQLSDWSTAIAERCVSDPNLTLFGSNYQDVFAFFVLIAVLVFRPSGLLGERISDRA